jgi:diacylglycerol kinase family enzyme
LKATLVPTTGPGTAGGLARNAVEAGAGLVLAAGGDGTLNEAVQGMIGSQVPLGVLPAGTANVLANEMGMRGGISGALAALPGMEACRIAVGRLESAGSSRHFLLMGGVGLDAHVVYHVSEPLKARSGKFAYWMAGFSLVGRRLPEFRVDADGEVRTCSFALVSRVRNYGGTFEIARSTHLFDDSFEVVLFEGRSSARYLIYLAGVALKRAAGLPGVTVMHARRVCFSGPEDQRVHVQVDGEYAGPLPASIEIVPDALTLLVPPAYQARFANRTPRCQPL